MPLLKEWTIPPHGLAAIWKIEEPESFFAEKTGITTDIKSEHRRMEHVASRFLLQHLDNNEHYFSLSHSFPYVAAIVDSRQEAGIDIQTWHPGIDKIKNKFLSADEQDLLGPDSRALTVAWSVKEALYKWIGRKGIDFKRDLPIENFSGLKEKSEMIIYYKLSKVPQMIFIESIITTDFTCSYVIRAQDWAIY
jgi:phosphopantetheinyl transferase (holo-ACP synthase)